MAAFSGTFESPIVPVKGPFTSLLTLTSSESEGNSALQKTPDGATNILLSFGANAEQSSPESFLYFELYEDVENTYTNLESWKFSNFRRIKVLQGEALTLLPYHWRVKVENGKPLRTIYVNFQYI